MELFIGNQLQVCYDSWLSTIYNFLMFVHFYYVWPYFISSSKNPLINHLNFYCTRNTCTQQPLARLPNLFSVTLVKIPHVFTRVILCEFVWTYVITCDRLCEDMILATWDRLLGALWDRFRFRNIVLSFLSSSPPLSMVSKPTVYKYWLRFKNTLKLVIGYPASFFNRLLGVWYRSKEHFLANWQWFCLTQFVQLYFVLRCTLPLTTCICAAIYFLLRPVSLQPLKGTLTSTTANLDDGVIQTK